MSSGKEKKFDAVELMRSIRDQLVTRDRGVIIADELRWWQTAELRDPKLARLAAKATQQPAPAGGRKPR
jgi:hypothetical protein